MLLLDLADDILGIDEEHLHASRKKELIKTLKCKRNQVAVLSCWSLGASHKTPTLKTDGQNLFSYALKIGLTESNTKVLKDYTAPAGAFSTHTTSLHVNKARKYADKIINIDGGIFPTEI